MSVPAPPAYELTLDPSLSPRPVIAALIWAESIDPPRATDRAPEYLTEVVGRVRAVGESWISEDMRRRVRGTLRYGKYKPSGRGKPASEFLLRAALHDEFPLVCPPVDVNNAVSLESGLPGSIFDVGLSGCRLLMRRGAEGEEYTFNSAGQSIDLQDLLLVCRLRQDMWEPCGNPVKDSMATKIQSETRDVVAVLYAPADEPRDAVCGWAERYAAMLIEHCGAVHSGYAVVG